MDKFFTGWRAYVYTMTEKSKKLNMVVMNPNDVFIQFQKGTDTTDAVYTNGDRVGEVNWYS